jgi:1,5-anhydro-D-fructose reductase (1,5-anhydro-D-mannitol-forming)
MTVNWALVGLGIQSEWLAPAFKASTTGRLIACASRTYDRAKEYAEAHGVPRPYATYQELLKDPDVDAVFVATPNNLHHPIVLAAAASGKHVLCEKPMAPTVVEAEEMVSACAAAGVTLRIGLHFRVLPVIEGAAKLVREGKIGSAREVVAQRYSAIAKDKLPAWRKDLSIAIAGVLTDVAVHLVDFVQFIVDDRIERVFAVAYPPRSSGQPDESVAVVLEFAGGCQATVRASRGLPVGNNDLHVFGTKGTISTGPLRFTDVHRLSLRLPDHREDWEYPVPNLYLPEIDAFARELVGVETGLATGADGLRLVHVTEAAVRSLETGAAVPVAGEPHPTGAAG